MSEIVVLTHLITHLITYLKNAFPRVVSYDVIDFMGICFDIKYSKHVVVR